MKFKGILLTFSRAAWQSPWPALGRLPFLTKAVTSSFSSASSPIDPTWLIFSQIPKVNSDSSAVQTKWMLCQKWTKMDPKSSFAQFVYLSKEAGMDQHFYGSGPLCCLFWASCWIPTQFLLIPQVIIIMIPIHVSCWSKLTWYLCNCHYVGVSL